MMDSERFQRVVDLFQRSGSAHHRAYIDTDGVDPEWPLWYASYLRSDLSELLRTDLTKSEIVYALLAAEKERQREDSGGDWPEFYTRFFLAQYGT